MAERERRMRAVKSRHYLVQVVCFDALIFLGL